MKKRVIQRVLVVWMMLSVLCGSALASPQREEPAAYLTNRAIYTITFTPNGGWGEAVCQSFAGGEEQTLLPNSFTRMGYSFAGWNTNPSGGGIAYADQQPVTIHQTITLYAQWVSVPESVETISVAFSANDGTGATRTQTFTSGVAQNLLRNSFVRSGYVFSGWNTHADGSGHTYTDGQSVTISGSLTLYAQWKEVEEVEETVVVTFSANDGTGTVANQAFVIGRGQSLRRNTFVRSGYQFQGWNTSPDGSGSAYTDGQSVTLIRNMTLYAQWESTSIPVEPVITVTFVANDGTGTMLTQSFRSGEQQGLLLNSFVRNGYTFTGWNTSPSGSGSYYADGETVTLTGSLTLYARWEKNKTQENRSAITATAGEGGTITPNGKLYRELGESVTFTMTPRTGYEISEVWVDGRSIGAASSYRLNVTQSNHVITVNFRKKGMEAISCARDWRCPMASYTDCSLNAWYHDGVHYCLERGIMVGVSEGNFAPNGIVTRGQFVTILYQLAGRPSHAGQALFSDVKPGDWFYDAVVWAGEHGLITGSGIGKFFPNEALTREELALMLYRYAGTPITVTGGNLPFSDESAISSYTYTAVRWAYENELLTGMGDGTIAPQGTATRAQIACVIRSFLAFF